MSLIVEDGTIVAGAESFVTVAAANTYHSNRGNATWATITTAQAEEALRRATDYMEQMYRNRWKGFRVSSSQALSWPRADVELEDGPYRNTVATDIVPTEVKNACSEYALRAAAGELAADLEQAVVSEGVGPMRVEYDRGSPEWVRYRALDATLALYLKGSSSMAKLVRS